MLKTTTKLIITGILAIATVVFLSTATHAIGGSSIMGGAEAARGDGVPTQLATGDNSLVKNIINLALYGVAAISVIMLIYGGFKYIISGGQKEKVTEAKNTILYAIVGLVIAMMAYAIVHFVINQFIGGGGSSTDI